MIEFAPTSIQHIILGSVRRSMTTTVLIKPTRDADTGLTMAGDAPLHPVILSDVHRHGSCLPGSVLLSVNGVPVYGHESAGRHIDAAVGRVILRVAGQPRRAECCDCLATTFGCFDPRDGHFYCQACWDTLEAQTIAYHLQHAVAPLDLALSPADRDLHLVDGLAECSLTGADSDVEAVAPAGIGGSLAPIPLELHADVIRLIALSCDGTGGLRWCATCREFRGCRPPLLTLVLDNGGDSEAATDPVGVTICPGLLRDPTSPPAAHHLWAQQPHVPACRLADELCDDGMSGEGGQVCAGGDSRCAPLALLAADLDHSPRALSDWMHAHAIPCGTVPLSTYHVYTTPCPTWYVTASGVLPTADGRAGGPRAPAAACAYACRHLTPALLCAATREWMGPPTQVHAVHVHVRMRACACVHMYMCACVCVCMCACACVCICMCVHVHVCARAHVCMYARVHVCMLCHVALASHFSTSCGPTAHRRHAADVYEHLRVMPRALACQVTRLSITTVGVRDGGSSPPADADERGGERGGEVFGPLGSHLTALRVLEVRSTRPRACACGFVAAMGHCSCACACALVAALGHCSHMHVHAPRRTACAWACGRLVVHHGHGRVHVHGWPSINHGHGHGHGWPSMVGMGGPAGVHSR